MPQLILRGFASDDRVGTVRLSDRRAFVQSIDKAAAQNHFNTVRLADGSSSDEVERLVANEIEGPAADPLARLGTGGRLMDRQEREAVGLFLAFQYVRVPWQRQRSDAIADKMMKLELAAGGPRRLRESLSDAQGQPVSEQEAMDAWNAVRDFDAWDLQLPPEQHMMDALRLASEFVGPLVDGFVWSVLRWRNSSILTTDMPVLLTPYPGQPSWQGAGLFTAACIHFPLHRRAALVLSAPGVFDLTDGAEIGGTIAGARRLNRSLVGTAHEHLYHHPDDTLENLLGPDVELPDPMDPAFDRDMDNELRDQLRSMAEWHARHPDQPHPFSGRKPDPESGVEPWSYPSSPGATDESSG